jgi:hypothetical protein
MKLLAPRPPVFTWTSVPTTSQTMATRYPAGGARADAQNLHTAPAHVGSVPNTKVTLVRCCTINLQIRQAMRRDTLERTATLLASVCSESLPRTVVRAGLLFLLLQKPLFGLYFTLESGFGADLSMPLPEKFSITLPSNRSPDRQSRRRQRENNRF